MLIEEGHAPFDYFFHSSSHIHIAKRFFVWLPRVHTTEGRSSFAEGAVESDRRLEHRRWIGQDDSEPRRGP